MAAPQYKTKGELRSDLLIALGYGGLGAAAGNFVPRANYLLEQAQENLYRLMPDEKRVREWELNTGISQEWYDFPPDCDPDRIKEISVFFEQTWLKVYRGITIAHDSVINYINYYPQRYDIRAREVATELQTNGDMAIEDTSATGTTGFTWTASNWEIASDRAEHVGVGADAFTSDVSILAATEYTIEYTIGVSPVQTVSVGGKTEDINGFPFSTAIGSHQYRVLTTNTNPLVITSIPATAPTLDNISIKRSDASTVKAQLQFWPLDENRTYPFKIEGYIQLMPFVADGDRATVDDRLILLHAEAFGKAHMNKPDAGVVMNELKQRLALLRGEQHGEQRYIRGEKEKQVLPWPQVID